MNELKDVVVEETMEGLTEDVITADVDFTGAGIAKTVVKVLLVVGGVAGATLLYKKVIKPKLLARKAKGECVEAVCEEVSE